MLKLLVEKETDPLPCFPLIAHTARDEWAPIFVLETVQKSNRGSFDFVDRFATNCAQDDSAEEEAVRFCGWISRRRV
jgi:hypothetical protein